MDKKCEICRDGISGRNKLHPCDCCMKHFHGTCVGVTTTEAKALQLKSRVISFYCPTCRADIAQLPNLLLLISNLEKQVEEFEKTGKRRRIKNAGTNNNRISAEIFNKSSSSEICNKSTLKGFDDLSSSSQQLPCEDEQGEVKRGGKRRISCTCPYCLNGGMRTDDGRKLHICHVDGCNKVYGKTSHLQGHMRLHTGERPYACHWSYCGKRFTRSDELQRHERTHTGEKKYECTECDKRFLRNDHLTKHMKTHRRQNIMLGKEVVQVEAVSEISMVTADDFSYTLDEDMIVVKSDEDQLSSEDVAIIGV